MRIHRTILILTFVLGSILLYCTYSYAIPRVRSGGGGGSSSVTLVSPGTDADSTETDTPSGLELISSNLTLLRGCGDNQILKWDEVADDGNGEDDAGAAGGDSVTVNTTAIDTTANLKDTTTVTWAVVDGGPGGPDDAQATAVDVTCTACLSATELGTDSVSADELNATGVEAELESALDIGGEVTSTGMASVVIADSVAVSTWNLTTPTITTSLITSTPTTLTAAELDRLP